MTWWANARRLGRIARVLARHSVAHLAGPRLERFPRLARRLPAADLRPPQRLAAVLEDLGGTFLKFGQMLALQPDILSLEYCNALFNLLDRVAPFPYDEAERIFREETGRSPEEVFERVERVPIATASIGQVYAAWLDGQKVAVKIQRPKVEAEFAGDIRLMTSAVAGIRGLRLRRLYWLIEPVSEFVGWTREELDYRYEARYAELLRGLSHGNPIQYVPRVYGEHTTRRTLVVEYLDGVTLLDLLRGRERGDEVLERRLRAMGFDGRRFAAHVIDNFLGDAFRHGLYHADLHPANLMILPDNVVGYIDFGITGAMSPYSRRHLVVMTLALAQGDTDTLCSQFMKLSVYGPDSDVEGFRAGLQALARGWYEQDGGHRRLRVNFTRVMTDMLQLSRRANVMPERDIIKYIRSAIAIDGLNLRFEPSFHVGRHLEEECGRFLRWEAVRGAVSQEAVLAWSKLGTRLASEGPSQAESLLERVTTGELAVEARSTSRRDPGAEVRARAVNLSSMVLAVSALAALTRPPAVVGWNLFTVEITLALFGLALLVPTLRRLAASSPRP